MTSSLDNRWMNLHFDLCAFECLGGRYVQKLCPMLKRVTVYDNRFAPLLYLLCVAEMRKCLLRYCRLSGCSGRAPSAISVL